MVNTEDDDWWMIYHGWKYGRIKLDPGRQVLIDKVEWTEDGWPHIGSASETPQKAPVEIQQPSSVIDVLDVRQSSSSSSSSQRRTTKRMNFLDKVARYFDLRPPYPLYILYDPVLLTRTVLN